jgi:hypothetical protein
MKILDFNFVDLERSRNVPVCVYLPANISEKIPVVIFGPGYQGQEVLSDKNAELGYKKYEYLAEYFASKNYCFISIQHDIFGDNDGLESIDPKALQAEARKHLWQRGEINISFVMNELKQKLPDVVFDQFIIAGHSNGGDIAKFYAGNHPKQISHVIVLDGRRCPIKPSLDLKILMFEANDTTTDIGVLPDEGTQENPKRNNLELIVIKPKNAVHMGYHDKYITEELKNKVLSSIDWFLG